MMPFNNGFSLLSVDQRQMPKHECRMTKETRMTKPETACFHGIRWIANQNSVDGGKSGGNLCHSSFDILSSFDIRASSLLLPSLTKTAKNLTNRTNVLTCKD